MVLAAAGLMLSHSLAPFSATMNVCAGAGQWNHYVDSFLITQLYKRRQHGSQLLFTDSFFSMAGMIFPWSSPSCWRSVLNGTGFMPALGPVYLAIFILAFGCEFPALGKYSQHSLAPVTKEN